MIDTTRETMLTLYQARFEFPGDPSAATVWRWVLKGLRGTTLESIRIGGRRFTSKEACLRFIDAINDQQPIARASKSEQRKATRLTKAILDHYGI